MGNRNLINPDILLGNALIQSGNRSDNLGAAIKDAFGLIALKRGSEQQDLERQKIISRESSRNELEDALLRAQIQKAQLAPQLQERQIGLQERRLGFEEAKFKQENELARQQREQRLQLLRGGQVAQAEIPIEGETKTFGELNALDRQIGDALSVGDDRTVKMLESQRRSKERRVQNLEKGVEKLSSRFEKSGLTDLVNSVSVLNNVVAGIPEGGDIPGAGLTGRLPTMLLSQQGAELSTSLSNLRNALLKARSGGAVTPAEAKRLEKELGAGATDRELRIGLNNVTKTLRQKFKNVTAGFNPEIVDLYQQRGGQINEKSFRSFGDIARELQTTTQQQPTGAKNAQVQKRLRFNPQTGRLE